MKRSESRFFKCIYHRVLRLHEIRMMGKKKISFIEFDHFVKIYTGDYLFVKDVREYLDLFEVLFVVYNCNVHKFYTIRTYLNRQKYQPVLGLKKSFVQICYETKSIEVLRKTCDCSHVY